MKNYFYLFLLSLTVSFTSCTRSDNNSSSFCTNSIIVDSEEYHQTNTDLYKIKSAKISGDCLEIEYSTSGCDADAVKATMLFSGAYQESIPMGAPLRLKLENSSPDCEMMIHKSESFNLKSLRAHDENHIIIAVEGWHGLDYMY